MFRPLFLVAVCLALHCLAGCGGKPTAPAAVAPIPALPKVTYSEALQTYESEIKELERLKADFDSVGSSMLKATEREIANDKKMDPSLPTEQALKELNSRMEKAAAKVRADFKPAIDAANAKIEAQQAHVDAAKKVVDELRKSK